MLAVTGEARSGQESANYSVAAMLAFEAAIAGVGVLLIVAIAGGVVAFFASARSLQIGPAVPVIAVTAIAGNASAIPAGVVVFGDPLGSDALTVIVRVVAFMLVVAAAALIPAPTRATGEPEPEPEPEPVAAAPDGRTRRCPQPGCASARPCGGTAARRPPRRSRR